jgi:hypothetical protein
VDLLRNTQQPLLAICLGPVLEPIAAPVKPAASPQAPKKNSQSARAVRAARASARN